MKNPPKRFKRVKEDFECFNCGTPVKGTGYTDHCPGCLWSLHVDNNPGDRSANCGGKMKPLSVFFDGASHVIYYRCLSCGTKKNFKASENDDLGELLSLVG